MKKLFALLMVGMLLVVTQSFASGDNHLVVQPPGIGINIQDDAAISVSLCEVSAIEPSETLWFYQCNPPWSIAELFIVNQTATVGMDLLYPPGNDVMKSAVNTITEHYIWIGSNSKANLCTISALNSSLTNDAINPYSNLYIHGPGDNQSRI